MVKIQKILFASLDPVKFQTRRFFSEKKISPDQKKACTNKFANFVNPPEQKCILNPTTSGKMAVPMDIHLEISDINL